MPVRCTFSLNSRETSRLACEGFGSVVAYSGRGKGRDNPYDVADKDVGALPPGTYYLVDRSLAVALVGCAILPPLTSEARIEQNGSCFGMPMVEIRR